MGIFNLFKKKRVDCCHSDSHDFVRADVYTGGIKYECKKCGLEAYFNNLSGEFDREFYGSYIDGRSFKWNSTDMDFKNMVKLSVSFGNYPIYNVIFEKDTVKYKNTINGSRDGWMQYPDGFFDEHSVTLDNEQISELFSCLSTLDIEIWETDTHIFDKIGASGFFLHDTFKCEFDNGRSFACYNVGHYEDFKHLTALLEKLCSFTQESFFNENYHIKTVHESENAHIKMVSGIVTPCCNIQIPESLSYCPKCGFKLEDKSKLVHLEVPFDMDDTIWLCECMTANAAEHGYCGNCGKKVKW